MRKIRRMLAVTLVIALMVSVFSGMNVIQAQAADKPAKPDVALISDGTETSVTVIVSGLDEVEGYCVYMKTKKDSKYKKVRTVKKDEYNWLDSISTVDDLYAGKYYFKVKSYSKSSGKTVWSSYSKAKSITLKGGRLDKQGIAETNTLDNGVTVAKTYIRANSVFNNGGYGSVKAGKYEEHNNINNHAEVYTYPKAGLIDRNAYFVMPYKETMNRYYFDDGIVSLVYPGSWGAYRKYYNSSVEICTLDGKAIVSDVYGATQMKDGYAFVFKPGGFDDDNSISQLINKNGQVVLDLQGGFKKRAGYGAGIDYDHVETISMTCGFSDGLLFCWAYTPETASYYGVVESLFYMNPKGEIVLSLPLDKYRDADKFSEGLARVWSADTGKIGYINKKGKLVIPCSYNGGSGFADGLASVCLDGKYGYINKKGETVIPFEYDNAYGAADGLASVVKDGKCGLVDYNNNIVVPLEYDDISSYEGGVAYAVKDGYVYIITGYTGK
ncbi:MAG: WG repeat-containing protein [Lachnospiraceae bacterium]|nr:WG repeat-containing protein [Lachnospiraceae bacterium]